MRFEELEQRLARRLGDPLPGSRAQELLAPRPRFGWQPGRLPADCRPGAALLLVYPIDGVAHLLLTERDGSLPQHAGQVSLPGGGVEEGETMAAAALREAQEEVGLDTDSVRVLGMLSPLHIPVSGFVLHPVVGSVPRRPHLRPSPGEVARVLETSVGRLAGTGEWAVETRIFRQEPFEVPYLDVEGARLWGATAMVVAEFLCVAGLPPESPLPPL